MTIAILAGARPNFIKAAPLWRALKKNVDWNIRLIHSGQHRDAELSAIFFKDLELPEPDVQLQLPRGTAVQQTAWMMQALEPVFQKIQPDWVLVIGDVNSTLAGTLAAKQLGLRVAHVEAGLRSGDRTMPEELNRIAVDHLSDLLFASEESGVENLRREGIADSRIHFSGNVLIDALSAILPKAKTISINTILEQSYPCKQPRTVPTEYALCTFHRPSNVDALEDLRRTFELIEALSAQIPVLFPCHPRTMKQSKQRDLYKNLLRLANVWVLPSLSYSEMIALMLQAKLVVTDSGGLQEETTFLQVPCLTFRKNTERPATLIYGTNRLLADFDLNGLRRYLSAILSGDNPKGRIPPLWDGLAAERIVYVLKQNQHKELSCSKITL